MLLVLSMLVVNGAVWGGQRLILLQLFFDFFKLVTVLMGLAPKDLCRYRSLEGRRRKWTLKNARKRIAICGEKLIIK